MHAIEVEVRFATTDGELVERCTTWQSVPLERGREVHTVGRGEEGDRARIYCE
jgi:hypothetical protein